MPTASESRLESRLQVAHLITSEASHQCAERSSQQFRRLVVMFQPGLRSEREQQTARLPFAIQRFGRHQLVVQRPRGFEQRLNGLSRFKHVTLVAAASK